MTDKPIASQKHLDAVLAEIGMRSLDEIEDPRWRSLIIGIANLEARMDGIEDTLGAAWRIALFPTN